jgi:nucleotide-binding universal stress UspA family protein
MSDSVERRSVVVGYSDSYSSFRAAQWAADYANLRRLPLVLVRALPSAVFFSPTDESTIEAAFRVQALAAAKGQIARDVVTLRQEHPELVVSWRVRPGEAADVLVDLGTHASLVVVGATGRSRAGAMLLGSTATEVANHASCAVAVWREDTDSATRQTLPVVVGVDGSPASELAVEQAFDFASMLGVRLVAVHTWIANELPYPATVTPTGDEERELALLAECLAGWSEKYPDVEVLRVCKQASPGAELLARARDAQLIVVGSHGHSGLAGTLLGSTSQRLLHRSPCPVLVCRSKAQPSPFHTRKVTGSNPPGTA